MCNFKSAIAVKDASEAIGFRLVWSPFSESHEDLVRIFCLKDTRDNLARVEFSPSDLSTAHRVETYSLVIDEARTPEWLTPEGEAEIVRRLRNYISTIIIDGEVDLLVGGQFILSPDAKINTVGEACVINAMLGDSQVGEMLGNAQVGEMWGDAQIGNMWDTSQVGRMRGNSKIGAMLGTSQIGAMWDTSKVGRMRGDSKIGAMWNTSKVGAMWDTSQIGEMLGTSQVGEMWETSQIGTMLDTSKIGAMRDSAKVGTMRGDSKVENDWRMWP
jgi:hypothetical protein